MDDLGAVGGAISEIRAKARLTDTVTIDTETVATAIVPANRASGTIVSVEATVADTDVTAADTVAGAVVGAFVGRNQGLAAVIATKTRFALTRFLETLSSTGAVVWTAFLRPTAINTSKPVDTDARSKGADTVAGAVVRTGDVVIDRDRGGAVRAGTTRNALTRAVGLTHSSSRAAVGARDINLVAVSSPPAGIADTLGAAASAVSGAVTGTAVSEVTLKDGAVLAKVMQRALAQAVDT